MIIDFNKWENDWNYVYIDVFCCYLSDGWFQAFFFIVVGMPHNGPSAAAELYNITAASIHGPKQRNLRSPKS